MLSPDEWQDVVRHLQLPPQQARVVAMVLHGQRNKQIARSLSLRETTVRTYMGRIFESLQVNDRTELVLRIFALCHTNQHDVVVSCDDRRLATLTQAGVGS
jgi:DNA-binding NarL/FixJ family response regulator